MNSNDSEDSIILNYAKISFFDSVPFPTPYLHSILWDGPAFTVLAFLSSLYPGESIREKSGIGQTIHESWLQSRSQSKEPILM